jgi:outer membrane protein assembly factor BamB
VLAFAVTGPGPFGPGPTPGVLLRQASGDRDISRVPEGLRGVVDRCLDILPGGRPTTDSLLELLGGNAIEDAVTFDDDQKPVTAQNAEIAATATTKMRAEPGKGAKNKQGAKAAKNTQRAQSTERTQSIPKPHPTKKTVHHDPTPTRRKFLLLGITTAAVSAFAWGVDEMPHGDGKTTGAETADDSTTTNGGGLTRPVTPGVLGGPLKNPTWSAKAASQTGLLTLSGNTLVVAGQGLTGYDTATGTPRWNVGSGTYSAPTEGTLPTVGDTVYEAAYGSGDMVAIRADDGTVVWNVPQPPKWLPSALVGASADVVVGLSYTDSESNSGQGLWAVDTHQTRELWHAPIGLMDGAPYYSAGTDLILLSQPESYQLTAYDAKTGREAWNAKDTAPRSSSPAFATAVASHGTTIYWATYQLYAYDQQGRPLWPVGVSEGESGQFHAVLADDDTVYAAAENDAGGSVIAAYKASDGAPVWRVAWPKSTNFYTAALEAQLALAGGILYVADRTDGDLIAVNAKTGETLWQFHDPDAKSGDYWQVAADERGVYVCYGMTVRAFLVT